MIYIWLSAILIVCFIGMGTILLALSVLNEKIDKYYEEMAKSTKETKPFLGRYDV